MISILDQLFGSPARVKIIRLFFLNPEEVFTAADVAKRAQAKSGAVRRELALLKKIGMVEDASKEIVIEQRAKKTRKNRKAAIKKKKIKGLSLSSDFPFYQALKNLVLDTSPVSREELLRKLKRLGKLKLVVLAGIFIDNKESRADMMIVGDGLSKKKFEKILRGLEAEIGKELNYALLETKEFMYRLGMYDKFVRDVLDYPHEKLLNKLNV